MKTGALLLFATLALAASAPSVAQTAPDPSSQPQTQPADQPATMPADQAPTYEQQATPDQPQTQPAAPQETTPVATQEQHANTDVSSTEAEASSSQAAPNEDELPRTASPLPLLALIGLIGILAAVGVRLVRQKSRA